MKAKNVDLYLKLRARNLRDGFVMESESTGRNFAEDLSTTTVDSDDSFSSKESDYSESESGEEVVVKTE